MKKTNNKVNALLDFLRQFRNAATGGIQHRPREIDAQRFNTNIV